MKRFAALAQNLGLNVLLEIHNLQELAHICNDVDVVGVNNRDLKHVARLSRSVVTPASDPSKEVQPIRLETSEPRLHSLRKRFGE